MSAKGNDSMGRSHVKRKASSSSQPELLSDACSGRDLESNLDSDSDTNLSAKVTGSRKRRRCVSRVL